VLSPSVDSELLGAFVIGVSRSDLQLLIVTEQSLSADQLAIFLQAVERRANREPLQHITGIGFFRRLELEVGPGVFTPRPETEQVVEFAIGKLSQSPSPLIVDLCAGSGAIAIALATELSNPKVYAVEKSEEAFAFLVRNFEKYGLDTKKIRNQELSESLEELAGRVDLVISNPPYIPDAAIPVDLEVQLHEPALALYGGSDGLDVIRLISLKAMRLLKPGGLLVLEHADTQAAAIGELLLDSGWVNIDSATDLSGKDRMISATKP
jgi:release factor glutamine methyltransferase